MPARLLEFVGYGFWLVKEDGGEVTITTCAGFVALNSDTWRKPDTPSSLPPHRLLLLGFIYIQKTNTQKQEYLSVVYTIVANDEFLPNETCAAAFFSYADHDSSNIRLRY